MESQRFPGKQVINLQRLLFFSFWQKCPHRRATELVLPTTQGPAVLLGYVFPVEDIVDDHTQEQPVYSTKPVFPYLDTRNISVSVKGEN